MPTLHPYDEREAYDSDPWAPLPEQMQAYLQALDGFPRLGRLADCDPFADTRFDLEATRRMAGELDRLKLLVTRRAVPTPPSHISFSPGEAAEEAFGWDGPSEFRHALASVLDRGISLGLGFVSVGD